MFVLGLKPKFCVPFTGSHFTSNIRKVHDRATKYNNRGENGLLKLAWQQTKIIKLLYQLKQLKLSLYVRTYLIRSLGTQCNRYKIVK